MKNTYKDKEIDNLFWYTPYKLFAHISPPLKLPELCVYDLSQKQLSCMDYDSKRMMSTCNFDREQNFTKILHEKTTADRLI